MNKLETAKLLASAGADKQISNSARTAAMREAKTPEEWAQALEPLAISMSMLADQATMTIAAETRAAASAKVAEMALTKMQQQLQVDEKRRKLQTMKTIFATSIVTAIFTTALSILVSSLLDKTQDILTYSQATYRMLKNATERKSK